MDNSKKTSFGHRLSAAAGAKKPELEKFRARSAANDLAFAIPQAARHAITVARDARAGERDASRLPGLIREAAEPASRRSRHPESGMQGGPNPRYAARKGRSHKR